jgi:hypothetical protein
MADRHVASDDAKAVRLEELVPLFRRFELNVRHARFQHCAALSLLSERAFEVSFKNASFVWDDRE